MLFVSLAGGVGEMVVVDERVRRLVGSREMPAFEVGNVGNHLTRTLLIPSSCGTSHVS